MLLLLIKAGNWSNLDPVRFFDNISFSRSFQTLRNWHWQIMRISEIETGKVVLSNDTMLTTPNSPPLPRSGVGTLRILDTLYLLKRHFVPWTLCTFSEDTLYLVTSYLLTRHFVPSYKTLRTFLQDTSYLRTSFGISASFLDFMHHFWWVDSPEVGEYLTSQHCSLTFN